MSIAISKQFKDTMQATAKDPKANEYDAIIKEDVAEYNHRLANTPGYATVDWRWFKAVLWIESGGPTSAAWKSRPMQIGNPGDPGYSILKKGTEGADIILSDDLKGTLKSGSISQPKLSVAYIFVRLANTEIASVTDTQDAAIHEYVVVAGDSFDKIAGKVGTTIEVLKQLNPSLKVIHPKDKVQYRKAKMQRQITGWRLLTAATLASRYNVGDSSYAEKLNYVKALLP